MQSKTYLYLMGCESRYPVSKVGISNNPAGRLNGIQCGNPDLVWVEAQWAFGGRSQAEYAEATVHRAFDEFRARGEWFSGAASELRPLVSALLTDANAGMSDSDLIFKWEREYRKVIMGEAAY